MSKPNLHPLVKRLFDMMREDQVAMRRLANRSGYDRKMLYNWRNGSMPSLSRISEVYEALGYDLVPVKKEPKK